LFVGDKASIVAGFRDHEFFPRVFPRDKAAGTSFRIAAGCCFMKLGSFTRFTPLALCRK
jgi:hypothetical protein